MKFLNESEVKHWCEARGVELSSKGCLRYRGEELHGCLIKFQEECPSRLIALVDAMIPAWEEVPFSGGLLWIRQRGAWGEHSEDMGDALIAQLRVANGEREPLEVRPGHAFSDAEPLKMHSFLVVPLLFGWDAYLVPEARDYLVYISHDGIAEVVARTAEGKRELLQRFRRWSPLDELNWYKRTVG